VCVRTKCPSECGRSPTPRGLVLSDITRGMTWARVRTACPSVIRISRYRPRDATTGLTRACVRTECPSVIRISRYRPGDATTGLTRACVRTECPSVIRISRYRPRRDLASPPIESNRVAIARRRTFARCLDRSPARARSPSRDCALHHPHRHRHRR